MGYRDKIQDIIMEEIAGYSEGREVVKAGILEILSLRYLPPEQMHPNPEDEFCDPDVGPSEQIVEEYVLKAQKNLMAGVDSFDEPIMVAKMNDGGYMIINGHHRWAAAIKTELKRVRVVIANPGRENLLQYL